MVIRSHRTLDALRAIEPSWNALLQRSGSDAIFLTWEWISTWWEVFGSRFSLLVLTAEDDNGRLIGIAPLMVGPRRTASGLTFRALMIIGQRGDTLAEYLDFIVEPGSEAQVTGAFCEFLQRDLAAEWDFIFFERILTTSPNLPVLLAKTTRPPGIAARDAQLKSPYIALGDSWPALLGGKSRNFRNQWNNSWNRLQAEGEVQFLFGGKDMPLSEALAEVTRLHRERWEDRSASFKTDEYLEFHQRLCTRLHAKGWLLLLLLSVNGENVAVRYDYVYAEKILVHAGRLVAGVGRQTGRYAAYRQGHRVGHRARPQRVRLPGWRLGVQAPLGERRACDDQPDGLQSEDVPRLVVAGQPHCRRRREDASGSLARRAGGGHDRRRPVAATRGHTQPIGRRGRSPAMSARSSTTPRSRRGSGRFPRSSSAPGTSRDWP